jgi:alpha-glucosidase
MYKQALAIRKELDLGQGSFEWVEELCSSDVLTFRINEILVIHNFGNKPLEIQNNTLIISSLAETSTGLVQPNETVWLKN